MKDEELLKEIHLGDENAAEELINRYYAPILRYCKSHCSDLTKAEDLTQERFLRVFRTLSEYKEKGCFKAYIYTIANHLCVDESRKVQLYSLENEEELVDDHDEMLQVENKTEIDYLLSILSLEQREAVILHFGEQLSFGEISKVMNCNMRTVQSRVRNALKIMRKERGHEG